MIFLRFDLEGNSVFNDQRNFSFKFIHKIFDITNGSTDKINSWIFQNGGIEYTGNQGSTVRTTYNKYLLAFWSKKSEFPIFVRRNYEKAIDFIGKDLSMKTKAENLEIMLQMMQAKIKDSI